MIRRPPRSTLFPSPTLFRPRVHPRERPAAGRVTEPSGTRGRRLAGEARGGSRRALARLLTEVENRTAARARRLRSEEHTSELQSPCNLVCRLLLEKKKSNAR